MTQLARQFLITAQQTKPGVPAVVVADQHGEVYGRTDNAQLMNTLLDTVRFAYAAGIKGLDNEGFDIQMKARTDDGQKIRALVGRETHIVYAGLSRGFGSKRRLSALKETAEKARAVGMADKAAKPGL